MGMQNIDLTALNNYIQKYLPDFETISSVESIVGGYSNLTFLAKSQTQEFVFRMPPKGAENIKGGHDMHREFNILNKIYDSGFKKIPQPILFVDDPTFLGAGFYIMEKVEGTVFRANLTDAQNEYLSNEVMHKMSINLCQNFAEMHKININETGLCDIGKPEGYIKRQVEGWYGRYEKSKTEALAEPDYIYTWLKENMPSEMQPCLIHNDFKYDNVVFDTESQSIKAILDWEMATIGDPRMDIGTCLCYWCEAADGYFEKTFNFSWKPGNLTREEFVTEYQKTNPIDLSNILYFFVFGLFKNAVVLQQIYYRYHAGLTQDKRFEKLNKGVLALFIKTKNSINQLKML